ncbi:MAG: septum formation protein Maf [Ruminococcus sp.]|jgi:septum formation protein|nr:septum formation protein Maf [Ruminococcus sp.]
MSLTVREELREYDVILASSSPRRKELLNLICPTFRVIPPQCEEKLPPELSVDKAAEYLSDLKCRSIAEVYENSLVIGCDTMVICDNAIYGKPSDEEDAKRMLRALSGREHKVISGVTIGFKKKYLSFSVSTRVKFHTLSETDIDYYCRSGEPMDKAGAYGIQGFGSLLVEKIDGEYYNVVGLPVSEMAQRLGSFLEICE